jgi:hypothetical protein
LARRSRVAKAIERSTCCLAMRYSLDFAR